MYSRSTLWKRWQWGQDGFDWYDFIRGIVTSDRIWYLVTHHSIGKWFTSSYVLVSTKKNKDDHEGIDIMTCLYDWTYHMTRSTAPLPSQGNIAITFMTRRHLAALGYVSLEDVILIQITTLNQVWHYDDASLMPLAYIITCRWREKVVAWVRSIFNSHWSRDCDMSLISSIIKLAIAMSSFLKFDIT